MTTAGKSFTPLIAIEPFQFPAHLDKKYEIVRGNTWIAISYLKGTFKIDIWYIDPIPTPGLGSRLGMPLRFEAQDLLELIRRNPILKDYQFGLKGRAKHALFVILDGKTPNAFIAPFDMLDFLFTIPSDKIVTEVRKLASDQVISAESSKQFKLSESLSAMLPETLRLDGPLPSASGTRIKVHSFEYDVFICHASEDKKEVAEPLARMLMDKGLKVWYDKFTVKIGDSLRQMIDNGLAHSRYGIVILSPFFFKKNWPQRELDGLAAREDSEGHKVILPVWHNVDRDYVTKYSPTLADRFASRTTEGLGVVLEELLDVILEHGEEGHLQDRITSGKTSVLQTSSKKLDSREKSDEMFMRVAIELSKECRPEDDRPHPKVAGVVVKNDEILDQAYRGEYAQGDHAEYTLLERKLGRMDLTGTTLYTTLEPCTVRGHEKTPCADRIIQRRIGRVVIGMLDPNPNIQGKGMYKLDKAGVRVQLAERLTSEIKELNKNFIAAQERLQTTRVRQAKGIERAKTRTIPVSSLSWRRRLVAVGILVTLVVALFGWYTTAGTLSPNVSYALGSTTSFYAYSPGFPLAFYLLIENTGQMAIIVTIRLSAIDGTISLKQDDNYTTSLSLNILLTPRNTASGTYILYVIPTSIVSSFSVRVDGITWADSYKSINSLTALNTYAIVSQTAFTAVSPQTLTYVRNGQATNTYTFQS